MAPQVVVADADELAYRLLPLPVALRHQHQRCSKGDQPSGPGDQRRIQGDTITAGDVRSCKGTRRSHIQNRAALLHPGMDLGGGQALGLGQAAQHLWPALVDRAHLAIVNRIRRQTFQSQGYERVLGLCQRQAVGDALLTDRRHALGGSRCGTERTGPVSGVNRHTVRQLEQFVMYGMVQASCQRFGKLVAQQVGAGRTPDDEGTAGKDRRGRVLAGWGHGVADVFRRVAGGGHHPQRQVTQTDAIAFAYGLVLEGQRGLGAGVDLQLRDHGGEFPRARDKVSVQVRVQRVSEPQSQPLGHLHVAVHIPLRVDGDG